MLDRVYAMVSPEPNTGCWIWTGALSRGYGVFSVTTKTLKKTWAAHRLLYETEKGPIPEGLGLDHLCRNKWCVNPDHLEPVTQKENVRRGDAAAVQRRRRLAKTHCDGGHPLSGDNLYAYSRKGTLRRGCKACRLKAVLKFEAKRRAEDG